MPIHIQYRKCQRKKEDLKPCCVRQTTNSVAAAVLYRFIKIVFELSRRITDQFLVTVLCIRANIT